MAFGRVYSYTAGTNTFKAIFANAARTVAHDNPATLDASGRLIAYGVGAYKFVFKTRTNVTVFTVDNYVIPFTAAVNMAADPFGPTLTQTTINATNLSVQSCTIASLTVTGTAVFPNTLVNIPRLTGVLAADLNASENRIVNLGAAVAASDAVRLSQVQADFVSRATGSLSGNLTAGGHRIVNLGLASDSHDAVRLAQVQSMLAAFTLPAGGNIIHFTTTQNWSVPLGVTRIFVTAVGGGGGGGGGGNEGNFWGAGGRAASGYWNGNIAPASGTRLTPIAVTPGEILAITIGAGGAGGANGAAGASGTAGLAGTNTVLRRGVTVLVQSLGGGGGGAGGSAANASTHPAGMLGEDTPYGIAASRPTLDFHTGSGAGGSGGIRFTLVGGGVVAGSGFPGGPGLLVIEY